VHWPKGRQHGQVPGVSGARHRVGIRQWPNPPSSGRAQGRLAPVGPPLMSNVRTQQIHRALETPHLLVARHLSGGDTARSSRPLVAYLPNSHSRFIACRNGSHTRPNGLAPVGAFRWHLRSKIAELHCAHRFRCCLRVAGPHISAMVPFAGFRVLRMTPTRRSPLRSNFSWCGRVAGAAPLLVVALARCTPKR
jgi:hypothetical protein